MTSKIAIPLSFSDTQVGTEEYGFIPRQVGGCGEDAADDEDLAYQRHVRRTTGDKTFRVVEGQLLRRE